MCLITKDPQRQYKDLINPMGLKSLTKIVGVSKLKTKYKPFEIRRQLCNEFDLFLADERVLPLLPGMLGKVFFEKKKYSDLLFCDGLEVFVLEFQFQLISPRKRLKT